MDVSIYQSIVNTAGAAYQDRFASTAIASGIRQSLDIEEADAAALLQPGLFTGPERVPFGALEDNLLDPLPSLDPMLATYGMLEATLLQSLPFAGPGQSAFGALGTRLNTFV